MPDDTTKSGPRAALITGGGRRIGAAIALALSHAGYAVVLHANRSRGAAEALAARIENGGGKAAVVVADLADAKAVGGLIPAAAFAPLTLLVNNASVFEDDEIGNLDRADFEATMAINLTAPLVLAQAFAAQATKASDASIVNIVDQRVLRPTPKFFSYTMSKSALHAVTVTLAQALAPLRVNAVAPGLIETEIHASAGLGGRLQTLAPSVPLRRTGHADEVAEIILFLLSDAASYVTGSVYNVTGGR